LLGLEEGRFFEIASRRILRVFHPKGIILKRQKHLLGKLNKDIRLAGTKKREI